MANKNGLEKIVETLGKIDPSFKVLNENTETVKKDKTILDQILENVGKIESIHTRKSIEDPKKGDEESELIQFINETFKDYFDGSFIINKSDKSLIEASLNSKTKKWFDGSKIVNPDGSPKIMYHATNENFNKFKLDKTTQGIFWFTSDLDEIKNKNVGAAGYGVILECYVYMSNPCGWEEYEKLGLGQLQDRGYDGGILPEGQEFVAFVFEPKQIKIVKRTTV